MLAVLTFIRTPFGRNLAIGIAGCLILLVLFFGLQAKGRADQRRIDHAAAEVAIAKAQAINAKAIAAADAERAADSAAVTTLQKDLNRAYENTPDGKPSAARLALACGRLRRTPQARLPEFSRLCGPDRGSQAAAQH